MASLCANKAILESFNNEIAPLLDSYCYDCHGFGISEGNVVLDEFTAENIRDHDLWLRVLKNTRAHVMPPLEEAQPSKEERQQLADWIKAEPFNIDPQNLDPGQITVQRLNRIEYQNTVNDLLDIDFNTLDIFPVDDSGEGFDNIGDVLTISPMLLEKYLDSANSIIAETVPTQSTITPEQAWSEEALVNLFSPGLPEDEDEDNLQLSFYTPSSRTAQFEIENEGDYQLIVRIKPKSFSSFRGFDYNECHFTFSVDEEALVDENYVYTSGKIHEFVFDRTFESGTHTFTASAEPLTDLEKVKSLKMEIEEIILRGPSDPRHQVKPPNYEKFFAEAPPREQLETQRLHARYPD